MYLIEPSSQSPYHKWKLTCNCRKLNFTAQQNSKCFMLYSCYIHVYLTLYCFGFVFVRFPLFSLSWNYRDILGYTPLHLNFPIYLWTYFADVNSRKLDVSTTKKRIFFFVFLKYLDIYNSTLPWQKCKQNSKLLSIY